MSVMVTSVSLSIRTFGLGSLQPPAVTHSINIKKWIIYYAVEQNDLFFRNYYVLGSFMTVTGL
jgi:hypothetical protein